MTTDKIISVLKDLVRDRKSFLTGDAEHDEVFQTDIAALEAAIQMIEKQRWISVENRLPEPMVDVLVSAKSNGKRTIDRAAYKGKHGIWRYAQTRRETLRVTHWMPLPDPPKEKCNDGDKTDTVQHRDGPGDSGRAQDGDAAGGEGPEFTP